MIDSKTIAETAAQVIKNAVITFVGIVFMVIALMVWSNRSTGSEAPKVTVTVNQKGELLYVACPGFKQCDAEIIEVSN